MERVVSSTARWLFCRFWNESPHSLSPLSFSLCSFFTYNERGPGISVIFLESYVVRHGSTLSKMSFFCIYMTIDYLENYSIKIGHICLANWMYGWKKYFFCTQRENIFPYFVRKVLRRRKIAQKYFLCWKKRVNPSPSLSSNGTLGLT